MNCWTNSPSKRILCENNRNQHFAQYKLTFISITNYYKELEIRWTKTSIYITFMKSYFLKTSCVIYQLLSDFYRNGSLVWLPRFYICWRISFICSLCILKFINYLNSQVNKYGSVSAGKHRKPLEHGSSISAGNFPDFFRGFPVGILLPVLRISGGLLQDLAGSSDRESSNRVSWLFDKVSN
jgi:hypothetical protein